MINCTINSEEMAMFDGKKYNHTYGELTQNGIKLSLIHI